MAMDGDSNRRRRGGDRKGAVALIGAWRDAGDDVIDKMVAVIFKGRAEDTPRWVELAN